MCCEQVWVEIATFPLETCRGLPCSASQFGRKVASESTLNEQTVGHQSFYSNGERGSEIPPAVVWEL